MGHNTIFKEHIPLTNLVRSVITGKSQAEVWDFPVMTNYACDQLKLITSQQIALKKTSPHHDTGQGIPFFWHLSIDHNMDVHY